METDKPLISILMAIYEPRLDWLREQLESLNLQTYPNLKLIIRDDCSPTVSFKTIIQLAKECITSFPFTISRNEKNLGSNGAFERLTEEAAGEYVAYCDQDDIWLPEKLDVLYEAIVKSEALLVCSDMHIIDENGKRVADSITKVRRHHIFKSGEGLAQGLLFSNFATGCTMLIKTNVAKAAIPFCPYMVHDHWLALFCAEQGKLISLSRNLVMYRIHSSNQTSMMAGVYDKNSYLQIRIVQFSSRMRWLKDHFQCSPNVRETIAGGIEWLEARRSNMERHGGAEVIWKYRSYSIFTSLFEIVATYFPEKLFMSFIAMIRKNVL
ncbi:MAG TPA: glycosyltransferase [Clostridia bacterium]|nr:glycosyltransferase [Clostridia bacterium]